MGFVAGLLGGEGVFLEMAVRWLELRQVPGLNSQGWVSPLRGAGVFKAGLLLQQGEGRVCRGSGANPA